MANWITLPSVSVTNGSITVSVTGGVDLSSVQSGWALIVNNIPVEIASGTAANGSGVSTLTLAMPWDGSTITNQPAKVQPTGAPFLAGIKAMQDTNEYAISVHKTLAEIATLDKDVTIKDPTGEEHTFATMRKIAREAQEFFDAAGTAAGYDVTQSATDTGNGANGKPKLLRVGDFGLGGGGLYGVFGIDLNSYIETGVYRNASHATWNNSLNKPASITTTNQTFVLTVDKNQSSAVTQTLHVESNRYFIRSRNIYDVWTPWREVLHTGNLVGTVSQLSSVPTGAIIERGSNANGEYTKFADGTMICSRTVVLQSGFPTSLDSKSVIDDSFVTPATFINTPSVQLTATALTTGNGGSARKAMSAWIRDQATSIVSTPNTFFSRHGVLMKLEERQFNEPDRAVLFFTAIGRWY
ncbi:pyocin knob domain-containing protein [Marinomonas shanghaiensis]|uniref:pyocin knob domain-containing protein n=1 Tax=Marinomonas shanghaiensis TaxID=2202418 RepID=UPI000DBA6787|nr:pyocin knob domain-containing protein [Marinomonas shanghaiensis]